MSIASKKKNTENAGSSCGCCPPRRSFLGTLGALGAAALLPGELMAQGAKKAPGRPHRIDVHHHLMYPGYLDEVGDRRAGSTFKWSPEMSLDDMDKSGIAVSVLSLIQPSAVTTDVEKGRKIARLSNEYGAQLARDHKGRFASFATLPLLDIEGTLKEIGYALDTIKAEGIGLMTSYQDKYLGDAFFAPIWEELNRRKAVIYTHPLSPECCRNIKSEVPPAVVEYATDTTRTIASLVFSGTASRYPDIRWIFSHSGGTMPFLLSRFTRHEIDMKEKANERRRRCSTARIFRSATGPRKTAGFPRSASRRRISAPSNATTRSSCCRRSKRDFRYGSYPASLRNRARSSGSRFSASR
jgi:predicted TIM-barrel fold metal-dependent hydrolase